MRRTLLRWRRSDSPTSATGFGFPFVAFLPSHAVGSFAGAWRRIDAIGVVLATYLNVFVLVAQLFRRIPALIAAAPTQSEPPFAITQVIVLALFVWLAVTADKGFRPAPL